MDARTEKLSELPSRPSLFFRRYNSRARLSPRWSVRLIGRRNNPSPSYFQNLADFSRLEPLPAEPYIVLIVLAITFFIGMRKPVLSRRVTRRSGCLDSTQFAAPITFSFGYYLVLLIVSLLASALVVALLPRPEQDVS